MDKDEFSLKEILDKVKPLYTYLVNRWYVFLITGLLFGGIGYVRAYFAKPEFKASLTFILSTESKSGGNSALAGIAGQFLDMSGGGGGTGGDVFKGETLLDYMNSFHVIKRVLFKPFAGQDSIFVNYFVRFLKLDDQWKNNDRTKNAFPFHTSEDQITPLQDSLLREVHLILVKNYLEINRPSKKLNFYEASTTSTNTLIASNLPRFLVDETAKLYIETQTKQLRDNVNMLQHEADTLGRVLSSSIQNVGASIDETYNLNPAFQAQRSGTQRQQVNVSVYTAAYSEVLRNLELAKIALQKEKPLFQIIDEPPVLLKVVKGGRIKAGLIWAFAAEILVLMIVLAIFMKRAGKKRRNE